MLIGLYRRVRFGLYMTRARKFSSRREYESALSELQQIFRVYKVNPASAGAPLVANLLYADEQTALACAAILSDIKDKSSYDSRHLNDYNIDYIRFRCKWLIARIAQVDNKYKRQSLGLNEITFDQLRPECVSNYLKGLFPMSREPGRQVDRFYQDQSA